MTVEITQLEPDLWQHRLTVSAAPPTVFDYLLDLQRHIDWEPELRAVDVAGGGPVGNGTTCVKTYGPPSSGLFDRIFSKPLRVTYAITAVDPPSRIAWKQHVSHRASGAAGFQRVEVRITPHDSGSELLVLRRLSGMDGSSAELVSRFSARLGDQLRSMAPQGEAGPLDGLGAGNPFVSGDLARHVLDGHPSRGLGPTALEHLKAVLDR